MNIQCPFPIQKYPVVTMAHGGGGTLMHQLIEKMFASTFQMQGPQHDSAVLPIPTQKIAMSTDSYVIHPLIFPGGNIGSMAIHGTINDLAMSGARPLYISTGFILEEGLPMETLWTIVSSMAKAAQESNIRIVTGDTKVVERGHGDGIFINTTGVGVVEHNQEIHPLKIKPNDVVIISGDVGRHGVAIMAKRSGFEFESAIESDSAAVSSPVQDLLKENIEIHCLRDCTRGGLISTLNEIGQSANLTIQVKEKSVPVTEAVMGACEMLGLDPMAVANEGRFVAFIPEKEAQKALEILKRNPVSSGSQIIGFVKEKGVAPLTIESAIGTTRIAPMLSGEQLPRIC